MARRTTAWPIDASAEAAGFRDRLWRQLPTHRSEQGRDIDLLRHRAGQGFQRIIPIDGRPHLPSHVRRRWGDSRGRWEGDTLVVDVTNFSPKSEFNGARQGRHMVERWRRKDDKTLEYTVTVEDPTWWTAPWTATEDFTKQSDRENRIYYEPRCHEGNHSFPAWLRGSRVSEVAHTQGRGPNPATKDTATDFVGVEDNPPQ